MFSVSLGWGSAREKLMGRSFMVLAGVRYLTTSRRLLSTQLSRDPPPVVGGAVA